MTTEMNNEALIRTEIRCREQRSQLEDEEIDIVSIPADNLTERSFPQHGTPKNQTQDSRKQNDAA